ncbi:hypothetical protein, partial [Desulfosporosinus sp.]|uniref:hypothetical protein n=1 Tax=Desulfosporosinus sp. TaxID=157907 RepID=UPI0025B9B59E
DLLDIYESEIMSILYGDEDVSELYNQYRSTDPVFMSKSKRDQFLKEIYGWKVYMGRNFLVPLDKTEFKFYREVIKYWSEKGYIVKKEKLGRVILIINAMGIDYVEKELLK